MWDISDLTTKLVYNGHSIDCASCMSGIGDYTFRNLIRNSCKIWAHNIDIVCVNAGVLYFDRDGNASFGDYDIIVIVSFVTNIDISVRLSRTRWI
jgi:hypothetical protein